MTNQIILTNILIQMMFQLHSDRNRESQSIFLHHFS